MASPTKLHWFGKFKILTSMPRVSEAFLENRDRRAHCIVDGEIHLGDLWDGNRRTGWPEVVIAFSEREQITTHLRRLADAIDEHFSALPPVVVPADEYDPQRYPEITIHP